MICPTCGYQNLPKDKFCKQCGMRLPQVKSSKLPLVIILSFLIFTALGTGIAYHFGVINNDPKYVKYDKIEITDITGKWKLVDGKNAKDFTKSLDITPTRLKFKHGKEKHSIKMELRVINEVNKEIVFANKDTTSWMQARLEKKKIDGVERVGLHVIGEDNSWGFYLRERK